MLVVLRFLCVMFLASASQAVEIPIALERYPQSKKLDRPVGTLDFRVEGAVLVVRAWFPDSAAGQLRTARLAPDNFREKDTYLLVYIDPAGAGQFAQVFGISPAGGVQDGLYREDGSTDYGIDFVWSASANIEDDGWRGEMRIPLASLHVARGSDQAPRVYARYFRIAQGQQNYSTHNPYDDGGCVLCKAPRLDGLSLKQGQEQVLRVRPSVFGSRLQERRPDQASSTKTAEAGLEATYQPSPGRQFSATLYPNFSDREPDFPILSRSTKFLTSLGETRQFFAQGSDISQTRGLKLINTRRFSDPRWGVQAVERGEGYDAKVVVADSREGGSLAIPRAYGQDFAALPATVGVVGRVNVARAWGNVGGALTGQHYADAGHNAVAAFDGLRRFSGGYSGSGLVAVSNSNSCATQGVLGRCDGQRGHALYLDWRKGESLRDWGLSFEQVSPSFRADLGAVQQAAYREARGWYNAAWPLAGKILNRFELSASAYAQRDWDGKEIASDPTLAGAVNGTLGYGQLKIAPFSRERLFSAGPVVDTPYLQVFASTSPTQQWSKLALSVTAGRLPDYYNGEPGRGVSGVVESIVTIRRHWDVTGFVRFSRSRAKEAAAHAGVAGPTIAEEVAQLRVQYSFSAFGRLRWVSELGRATGWNLSDTPATRFTSRRTSNSIQLSHVPRSGLSGTIGVTRLTRRDDDYRSESTEVFVKSSWGF